MDELTGLSLHVVQLWINIFIPVLPARKIIAINAEKTDNMIFLFFTTVKIKNICQQITVI